MIRQFLMGTGLFAVMAMGAGAVVAADLGVKAPAHEDAAPAPVPAPAADWAGFYIGINGGSGWVKASVFETFFRTQFPVKASGGLFGGHVGYNWQEGPFVLGVEADYDSTEIHATDNVNLPDVRVLITPKFDQLATARARLGYAVLPNILLYSTAGGAWGHFRSGYDVPILFNGSGFLASSNARASSGGKVVSLFSIIALAKVVDMAM